MSDKEKVLILSVGGSEEPLIYSINEFRPNKLVFLHTEGSYYQCAKILERLNISPSCYFYNELFGLFNDYRTNLFSVFSEYMSNFPDVSENKDFYLNFCDFLDATSFIDEKDFYYKFSNYLKAPNFPFKNIFNFEFLDIIQNRYENIDFYEKILKFYSNHRDLAIEFLDGTFQSTFETNASENFFIIMEEISNYQEIESSFVLSKKILPLFDQDNYEVRVDITGGTKTMSSGLVLGVVEGDYNYEIVYVGTDSTKGRAKKGLGTVKTGMEINKVQINPFKKYAITEFKRGKNFFDTYQFHASLKNFESAKESLSKYNSSEESLEDKNKEILAETLIDIVELYDKWDKFEDKYSPNVLLIERMDEIIQKINNNEYLFNEFNETKFFNQFKNNQKFLSYKISGYSPNVYFARKARNEESSVKELKDRLEYYLADLFNNSERRLDEKKYDDAVARLYRINELIAQIFLTMEGLIRNNTLERNRVFHIDIKQAKEIASDRENEYEIIKFICDNSNEFDLNRGILKVPNDKSYKFLELFDFEQDESFERLNKSLKQRNDSILAHGLQPVGEKAEDLYCMTLDYAKIYFPNLERDIEMARFPKFKDDRIGEN